MQQLLNVFNKVASPVSDRVGFKNVFCVALCAASGLALWQGPTAFAQDKKPAVKQFSNLSDGTWERQLEVPDSENLVPSTPLMNKALDTYAHLPFDIGERLKFSITYLGVKGGVAELMLRTPIKWKNGWAHRITGEVKSAEWYRWITRVHDSVEGVMDSSLELVPLRFYINQQESDFRQSKIVDFEMGAGKIKQLTQRKEREPKTEEFELATGTKDALGALYYFRERVAVGEGNKKFEFPIFTSEKTWTATAQLVKQEKRSISGTSYETDVYQLYTQFGGLMEQKGDIRVWLTRDSRRIPVYAEANVKFGYIKLTLAEWDQGYADPKRKKVYDKIRE